MENLLKLSWLLKAPLTFPLFLRMTKITFNLLEPSTKDVICDVGCGRGERISLLSNHIEKVVGMDIAQPVMEFLEQNRKSANVSFHTVDATAEPPPEFTGTFNKCLCMDLIEHVDNPELVFSFLRKLIRPDGLALIGIPINSAAHGRHLFNTEDVFNLADNLGTETKVVLFRRNMWGRLVDDHVYAKIRQIIKPRREGDYCHEGVGFEMMAKPKKIYFLFKLAIVFLYLISQNSYHETYRGDEAADRAFILAKRSVD